MRILHVVIDGELAGGQAIARALIEGGRLHGHHGVILSPTRGAFTEQAERDGLPVRYADIRRIFRLGGLARMRAILRQERIDLVHTHGMVAANALSRAAARSTGIPVISHLHGHNVFREHALAGLAYRRLDNLTARWCSRIIAVSEDTRRRLIEQGISGDLVETIHNGFDPPDEPVVPSVGELGLDGRAVVGCVGRLEPAKGQGDLLEAVEPLEGVAVLLVGRDVGGYRAVLERRAGELGMADRVVFAGARTDVLPLLAGCTLLAAPSWSEGFPVAPLEAMAVRKPVVATEVGGTPELVLHGETGILVPPRNPLRLREAIAAVLGDPALAERLGGAGYERLRERFSRARMVDRVVEVWESAR